MSYIKIGKNEYKLNITMKSVIKVQEEMGLNLLDPVSESDGLPLTVKIAGDDILLLKLVYCVLHEQVDKENITEEEFYDSIDGELMKELAEQFFKEYESFFIQRGRRNLADLLVKVKKEVDEMYLQSTDYSNSLEEADSGSTNA